MASRGVGSSRRCRIAVMARDVRVGPPPVKEPAQQQRIAELSELLLRGEGILGPKPELTTTESTSPASWSVAPAGLLPIDRAIPVSTSPTEPPLLVERP